MFNFKILIFLLIGLTLASFSSEEIEIFQTQKNLEKLGIQNFYSFLEITNKDLNIKQIIKQFKKISKKYHPDKISNPTKKDIKKYELLNIVYNILKSENRKRYDYYLQNGFPKFDINDQKFKFNNRFKPSLLFLIVFFAIILSIFHYTILKINYNSKVKKLERLIKEIKEFSGFYTDGGIQEKRIINQDLQQEFLIRIDGVYIVEKSSNNGNDESFIRLTTDDIEKPYWFKIFTIQILIKLWNKLGIYYIDTNIDYKIKEIDSNHDNDDNKRDNKRKRRVKLPNGKIVYK
ncbi:hypothetical protein WICMUC_000140 [Wickerhamomyces mucosus]|uniref:J domain-containing protein n=1 Tax=Wickerhamomyces mucosus TaxID=1378264 RepID=A0A9P8Q0Y1_9ASCO|nr:hypothetical protein WICMUC_000140 [Wickerhamomyces mucosus]